MGFSPLHALRTIYSKNDLTPTQRAVATCLAKHADSYGQCYPSLRTIAEECGISKDTAMRAVTALALKGWVDVVHVPGDRNTYRLKFGVAAPEGQGVLTMPPVAAEGQAVLTMPPVAPQGQSVRYSETARPNNATGGKNTTGGTVRTELPSKNKRSNPSASQKDGEPPAVHALIDTFAELYQQYTGAPYERNWARDGAILKGLLKSREPPNIEARMRLFFAEKRKSKPHWKIESATADIPGFKTCLPVLDEMARESEVATGGERAAGGAGAGQKRRDLSAFYVR